MKLEKKESKNIAISSKVTESQNEKLMDLSEKEGMTKSALIQELIKIGYMTYTKRKTF
jgi:predicted DNA-binding protein